jgi:hypothetical protein
MNVILEGNCVVILLSSFGDVKKNYEDPVESVI